MDILFNSICTWLAPILCFTSEEAWKTKNVDESESVHLQEYYKPSSVWNNDNLSEKWNFLRDLRLQVNNKIEEKRKEGLVGSSLEACIKLEISGDKYKLLKNMNLSEIFISSKVELLASENLDKDYVNISCEKAIGLKCDRCWKVLDNVNENTLLCLRCTDVIETLN